MDLLIELFSEEIPARMQAMAREALKTAVTNGLVEAGLTYASAGAFSTPRRLTLAIEGLSPESRATREERKGPRTDAPAAALEGFLRSTGLTREALEVRDDKKAQVYFAVIEKPGRPAAPIIAEVLEATIRNFPWPKSMRWGNGSLRWVRPLHSILCLTSDEAGSEVVPFTLEGLTAGNSTRGHRFMAPDAFTVTSFDDYRAKLKRAFVMLDSAEREAAIEADAQTLAFARGLEVVPDRGLLTEVAGLVEWPVVLMGEIAPEFLGLPPEVLQTSMKEHQKFFSVRNPKTGRIEGFVTVANRETADHGATILAGNQKVLSARLSDAKFFWENDLREAKAGMQAWAEGLKSVTFQSELGSQADRVARIAALAREIAPVVGADPALAEQAAQVAKLDLRSAMVGEFPELQGLMGMYYAREAGLPEPVARAARDHYAPLGPSDAVPTEPVSVTVALADKIDTLTGFWAIDEKPTGSKDPFALRRAALGVIRVVLGNGVRVGLLPKLAACVFQHTMPAMSEILEAAGVRTSFDLLREYDRLIDDAARFGRHGDDLTKALAMAGSSHVAKAIEAGPFEAKDIPPGFRALVLRQAAAPADLLSFLHDRLKVFLRDEGIPHHVIDACLAMPGNDDLTLVVARARALAEFLRTEDGTKLLEAFKRSNNMRKLEEAKDGVEFSYGCDPKFFEAPEEHALLGALELQERAIDAALKAEDFPAAMRGLAALRAPTYAFFDALRVNSDNGIVRRNRLNLISRVPELMARVADMSKVEG